MLTPKESGSRARGATIYLTTFRRIAFAPSRWAERCTDPGSPSRG